MSIDKELRSKIIHGAYRLVLGAVFVYILTATMIFFDRTSYIYFPDKTDFYDCPYFTDAEKIEQNGTRMYFRQNGEDLVVVYHGNAGRACDRTYYGSLFDDNNISYILVEYAGFSGDKKRPSRELILRDVSNVIAKLKTLQYKTLTIIGESVGSGVAGEHIAIDESDKLIFIAPFARLSDVSRFHYPFLPSSLLGSEGYDNTKIIGDYKGELLIIHGTDDKIIPFSMGKGLFDGAVSAKEKEFMSIEHRGHNDILASPKLFEKISEFILK